MSDYNPRRLESGLFESTWLESLATTVSTPCVKESVRAGSVTIAGDSSRGHRPCQTAGRLPGKTQSQAGSINERLQRGALRELVRGEPGVLVVLFAAAHLVAFPFRAVEDHRHRLRSPQGGVGRDRTGIQLDLEAGFLLDLAQDRGLRVLTQLDAT